jgi:hypothetical protein
MRHELKRTLSYLAEDNRYSGKFQDLLLDWCSLGERPKDKEMVLIMAEILAKGHPCDITSLLDEVDRRRLDR